MKLHVASERGIKKVNTFDNEVRTKGRGIDPSCVCELNLTFSNHIIIRKLNWKQQNVEKLNLSVTYCLVYASIRTANKKSTMIINWGI